jgi:hypothetical protein
MPDQRLFHSGTATKSAISAALRSWLVLSILAIMCDLRSFLLAARSFDSPFLPREREPESANPSVSSERLQSRRV